jgi:ferredoxin-NADP reductase
MSMLRDLDRREELDDVVHLHSAREPKDVIFGEQLRDICGRNDGFRLHEQHTGQHGRMTAEHLDELCPDWRERHTFLSGPGEMIDTLCEHWEQHGDPERLHMERFQPVIGGEDGEGEGGSVRFVKSDCEVDVDPGKPILVGGEEAGLELPFGCRMGICHTCVGKLCEGKLRDLRSGEVSKPEGQMVRTCIHAPEGAVVIEL